MKKLLSILFINILFSGISAFAIEESVLDEVYLKNKPDKEIEFYKKQDDINTPDYRLKIEKDYRITPQNIHSYNDFNPYNKKSTSITKEKASGNFSFGSRQDYTFSPDNYTHTSTLFTKYKKDNFSLNTSYQNNAAASFEQQKRGTLMFSPEYKLNEHFSLQNRLSNSFLDRSKKNEIIFSIKPFKDNRMNFDIGAGRVYSETTIPERSQLNFSTKFHF